MIRYDIKGYEVTTNSDLTEGRGHPVHVAYAADIETASYISRGKGVMGQDAIVKPVSKTITVFESINEYEESLAKNKKEAALAKLTEEEKQILGLK